MSVKFLNENTIGDPTRPILVYTVGKVGSQSLSHAIAEAGRTVFKAHNLDREVLLRRIERAHERGREPETDLLALKFVDEVQPCAEFVRTLTLVRESVGRNISGFFQLLWKYDIHPPYEQVDIGRAIDIFFREFNHDRPDKWFRQEFQKFLHINPFRTGFKPDIGFQELASGRFRVLLLQVELGNETLSRRISDFLGFAVSIDRTHNQSGRKEYADLYRRFRETIEFPRVYLDRICNSRVMQRFYSEAQREHVMRYYRREISDLHPFPRE